MKTSRLYVVLSIGLLLSVLSQHSSAQLVVNGGGTPQQIISAFVSSGLTVSNVVLNCGANSPSAAYGTFDGTNSNLGIPGGVMLTTGQANLAVGPNLHYSNGYCRDFNPMPADPQLTAIEPMAIYDLCVLEFDVVPHCDSLIINFAFGSEEYPEFVNQGFNDVFGFFVTGPGHDCIPGFYNNTNVAQLPNGDPVSIDNINDGYAAGCPSSLPGPCMNCNYYTYNCTGTTIEYDGLTKPIYVSLGVCPCATYHWKFAIADASDCVYDSGIFLNYLTSCETNFSYTVNSTAANCLCDGTASVNIAAGNPPYTYLWSPGGQTTPSVTGLCAGNYTVSVTDANACGYPTIQTFTIVNNNPISLTTNHNNENCSGDATATASVTPSGGNAPYTYSWTPIGQTTQTVSNLSAGTYTVTVTDNNGCASVTMVTVTAPSALSATSSVTNVSCNGDCNGSIAVTPGGGTPPYTYSNLSNLCAGTYSITFTDSHGCTGSAMGTITEPAPLIETLMSTEASCSSCSDGSITVNASGGTPSYSFSLTPAVGVLTGNTFNNVPPGNYTACVTDGNGCTSCDTISVSFTVSVESLLSPQQIYFYPNPFSTEAWLTIEAAFKPGMKLLITDVLSRTVAEMDVQSERTAVTRKEIPLNGIYFFKLISGRQIISRGKLMVID